MSTAEADPRLVRQSVLEEAQALLGAEHALLHPVGEGRAQAAIDRLLEHRLCVLVLDGDDARALAAALAPAAGSPASALLLPLPAAAPEHVLLLLHSAPDAFGAEAGAVAEALAAAGAAALERRRRAEQDARRAEQDAGLTRAAKILHESLDLTEVLSRICQEATRILDGDHTAVYRGSQEGIAIEAVYGLPPEIIGYQLVPGEGLSGKALATERAMLTNDYAAVSGLPPDSPFARVRSCLAVPMQWGGEIRGVITVGYMRPFHVTEEHLGLLETFGELAAVACSNASAHAGLALAARTDGLTGCLNHAALHESLRREIERAERAVAPALSLIMVDLDDFKSVNEVHGHLVGDEVLRRAGHALRQATRPYDVAARYGGDEFALVTVEAGESEAEEIGRRAIERITTAIADLCAGDAGRATGGVAEWSAGVSATELVARADRALLFGKHEDGRGRTVLFSDLPDWFRPGRFSRRTPRDAPASAPGAHTSMVRPMGWPEGARPAEERLRERTRRLAWANTLGARLSAAGEEDEILALAATELGRELGAAACTILLTTPDGRLDHAAGTRLEGVPTAAEQAVREDRAVLVNLASGPTRLAVPISLGTTSSGVIEVRAARPGAFDQDDLHLASTVAEHTAAALHSARRLAALRREREAALAELRDRRGAPADAPAGP